MISQQVISEKSILQNILLGIDTYDDLAEYIISLLRENETEKASEIVRSVFSLENLYQFPEHSNLVLVFAQRLLLQIVKMGMVTEENLYLIQPMLWFVCCDDQQLDYGFAQVLIVELAKAGLFFRFNTVIQEKLLDRYMLKNLFVELMLSGEVGIDTRQVFKIIDVVGDVSASLKIRLQLCACEAALDISDEAIENQGMTRGDSFVQQTYIAVINQFGRILSEVGNVDTNEIPQVVDALKAVVSRIYSIYGLNIDLQQKLADSNYDGSKSKVLQYLMWSDIREFVFSVRKLNLTFLFATLHEKFESIKVVDPNYVIVDREMLEILWPWLDLVGGQVPDSMSVGEIYRRLLRYSRLLAIVRSVSVSQNGVHGDMPATPAASEIAHVQVAAEV